MAATYKYIFRISAFAIVSVLAISLLYCGYHYHYSEHSARNTIIDIDQLRMPESALINACNMPGYRSFMREKVEGKMESAYDLPDDISAVEYLERFIWYVPVGAMNITPGLAYYGYKYSSDGKALMRIYYIGREDLGYIAINYNSINEIMQLSGNVDVLNGIPVIQRDTIYKGDVDFCGVMRDDTITISGASYDCDILPVIGRGRGADGFKYVLIQLSNKYKQAYVCAYGEPRNQDADNEYGFYTSPVFMYSLDGGAGKEE